MTGPGGPDDWRGVGSVRAVPLPVRVVRMEPRVDLAFHLLGDWMLAAGPLYRLPLSVDTTQAGYVIYDAWSPVAGCRLQAASHPPDTIGGPPTGHRQPATAADAAALAAERRIGYLLALAPRRRNFLRLLTIWVDLDCRRRGVGRRLVEECLTIELDDRRPWCFTLVRETRLAEQLFWRGCRFRASRAGPGLLRFENGNR